jgi:hypothetical protein
MNMVKVAIRIFPKLNRATVENGVQIYWLTTAGVLQVDTKLRILGA